MYREITTTRKKKKKKINDNIIIKRLAKKLPSYKLLHNFRKILYNKIMLKGVKHTSNNLFTIIELRLADAGKEINVCKQQF